LPIVYCRHNADFLSSEIAILRIFLKIMEINERFAHIRVSTGLNRKRFADSLGINQSVAGDIELGKRDPSREVMLKLATAYQVNINWLLTGLGEPFIKRGIGAGAGFAPPGVTGLGAAGILGAGLPGAVLGYAPPADAGMVARANSISNLDDSPAQALTHTKIPLLKQRVSCGPGVEWETEENIDEYIEVQTFIPRLGIGRVFAVKAQGSSMLGAGIRAGDYIFFDGSEEQRPHDGIYVFALDGEVYCKRIEFDNLSRRVKIFSVRIADLEKAELVASLDTNDSSFADRFCIFGRVTRCIRLIDVGAG
jgi:SOS-response transcriptional repressor LexA